MSQTYLDGIKKRRTNYAITDTDLPLEQSEIISIVRQALLDSPSPWNVSSSRAFIVMNEQHKKLFNDVIRATINATMSGGQQAFLDQHVKGCAGGAGSVLFFEDQNALDALGERHPSFKDAIAECSDASSGMAQFNVWTAFSVAGLGCSLQHLTYCPGVDDAMREHLQIPASWKSKSQLVFGKPTQEAGAKPAPWTNIDERMKVLA